MYDMRSFKKKNQKIGKEICNNIFGFEKLSKRHKKKKIIYKIRYDII